MEKYLNNLFKKKKAPHVRLELADAEFVSLRYNHLPTLQYNTRLIAYTVFVLSMYVHLSARSEIHGKLRNITSCFVGSYFDREIYSSVRG